MSNKSHDIIDNRRNRLIDQLTNMLDASATARFAVGYFFVSGFAPIATKVRQLDELRLLIGNVSNSMTIEHLAEGHRRLDLVANAVDAERHRKRSEARRMAQETATAIRGSLEATDQTDEEEAALICLMRLIEEGRVKVRVYTKGRLHSKAYIFDFARSAGDPASRNLGDQNGIAIVGSSNLTLAGVSSNTELNVVVDGNENHATLVRWFDELWDEAEDFDEALFHELNNSWAAVPVRPYDIYMKTLVRLVEDRLESGSASEILSEDEITGALADFQKIAVRQMVQIVRDRGGGFIADVVGLGKSFMGAAVVKHFEHTQRLRPLILCPPALKRMWELYDERFRLNARVLSMGMLRENEEDPNDNILADELYRDRDFLLIDESHNLRNPSTQRYRLVQTFLARGKPCCFLTATPRNKSAWDIFHQIKLFHQDDKTELPIDPPDLREFFHGVEKGQCRLPDVLRPLLIRRTRRDVLRWYGRDSETHEPIDPARFREYVSGARRAYVEVAGRRQFFPRRELETIEYSIEETYQGLYQRLRDYFGRPGRGGQPIEPNPHELTFARYGLWHYVRSGRQRQERYATLQRAGKNLRGLIRILLFKRFESSVAAFRATIERLRTVHRRFLMAIDEGVVPAGEDAQSILYEPSAEEEQDLVAALRGVSADYRADDFDLGRLRRHVAHDIALFTDILELVRPITPERDTKLQTLLERLNARPLADGKRLIFTQYADTARYLYENLGNAHDQTLDVIFSSDKDKSRVVGRFAPRSNPALAPKGKAAEILRVVTPDQHASQ